MIHATSPEITAFWERACAAHDIGADATRHVYTFADSSLAPAGLIDEITALAGLGKKRGTTHLRHDFEVNAIAMHAVGDYWLAPRRGSGSALPIAHHCSGDQTLRSGRRAVRGFRGRR